MISFQWLKGYIDAFQAIQKNGYDDSSLNDGPKSSWLGYSLLPEGEWTIIATTFPLFRPGTPIEFPLLFTENPGFNITSYLAKDEASGCFEMLGC